MVGRPVDRSVGRSAGWSVRRFYMMRADGSVGMESDVREAEGVGDASDARWCVGHTFSRYVAPSRLTFTLLGSWLNQLSKLCLLSNAPSFTLTLVLVDSFVYSCTRSNGRSLETSL